MVSREFNVEHNRVGNNKPEAYSIEWNNRERFKLDPAAQISYSQISLKIDLSANYITYRVIRFLGNPEKYFEYCEFNSNCRRLEDLS